MTCFNFVKGLHAMFSKVESTLKQIDYKPAADRRRSSELGRAPRLSGVSPPVSRQNSLVQRNSTLKGRIGLLSAEPLSGPKLQRLYTIDQDAFFPDLPQITQVDFSCA